MTEAASRATNIVRSYSYTGLFCAAIALLIWQIGATDLASALIISAAIGFSICSTFVVVESWAPKSTASYTSATLVTAIGLLIGWAISGSIIAGDLLYFFRQESTTLLLGVFFAVLSIILFGSRERMAQMKIELAEAHARESLHEKQALQSKLQVLQAQIEPHFLFNTLSNVISMIRSNPTGAEQTLENLTTLLRHSLNRTRDNAITLLEEINIVRAYLDIQAIRMGDRLSYSIDLPPALETVPLPPLLLQPLVENAVQHGLASEQGGEITITATKQADQLLLEVRDTGTGINQATTSNGTGTGIANINARLSTLFKNQARLRIEENQPHGVVATLELPSGDKP